MRCIRGIDRFDGVHDLVLLFERELLDLFIGRTADPDSGVGGDGDEADFLRKPFRDPVGVDAVVFAFQAKLPDFVTDRNIGQFTVVYALKKLAGACRFSKSDASAALAAIQPDFLDDADLIIDAAIVIDQKGCAAAADKRQIDLAFSYGREFRRPTSGHKALPS